MVMLLAEMHNPIAVQILHHTKQSCMPVASAFLQAASAALLAATIVCLADLP
jgi:hypothetical protein